MMKRRIDEGAQLAADLPVMARRNGTVGDVARSRIALIHPCRAAKRIARKLIEQDQQRQRAVRRRRPAIQLATASRLIDAQEFLAKQPVEIRILAEPHRLAGLLPERDDIGRRDRLRLGVAAARVAGMTFELDKTLEARGAD